MKIEIAGEMVELLPERALFWPKQKLLVIADLHLGKAATFRRAGIPIPEGAMMKDLERLHDLITKKGAERCLIIGDLLHHQSGLGATTLEMIEQGLNRLPCQLDLILGNHDRALKKLDHSSWQLNVHADQLIVEPFVFSHHPREAIEGYVLSGHLHPLASIKTGNQWHRFPCFFFQERYGILPAFTSFAGGVSVDASEGKIYACLGDEVLKI